MKKKLLVLMLALMMLLPLLGLNAETVPTPQADPTPAPTTGIPYGPRWRWNTAPDANTPETGYIDANGDGLCDNCGQEAGKNPDAPGFLDEDKDGVCDHFGTAGQGQGGWQGMRGRMQQMMGRMQTMRGRMQNAQGRMGGLDWSQGQGRMGGQGQAQGQAWQTQCPNFVDADGDGVCDTQGSGARGGCRRNRR
ncbi:MAG: hypothetical protein AB9880_12200 [Christensenellales bacterium]